MPAYKTMSFSQAISDRYYGGSASNAAVVGGMTSLSAYRLVPWLFRAVAWRAEHVASMPFALMKGDVDVTDDPVYASVIAGHRRRMFRTEAAKLLTGKAYWYKAANQFGRNVTPQWLLPGSVTPREQGGVLTEFAYSGINQEYPRQIPLDRMVWFWNENFESDVLPGAGEAEVALAAASMLHALDAFTANFFNQGGVRVTVFPVPTGTQDTEVAKLESFLARRLMSVRNAFRMVVMRLVDKLQPIVIGSDVKDTQAPELTELQRENAAVAMGVPPNVLSGNYKYATADSELVGYYMFTIIPEVERLFDRANEQFYHPFDLELVAHPERTEIMQAVQLQQVSAVQAAVGKPVLLEHEGRELLGFPPVEQAEKDYDAKLAELGLERKPEPVPPGMTPEDDEQDEDELDVEDADPEQVTKALAEWRRLALENVRGGGPYAVPSVIPARLVDPINAALPNCKTSADVRAVFARHWPKAEQGEPTAAEVLAALREATAAARELAV